MFMNSKADQEHSDLLLILFCRMLPYKTHTFSIIFNKNDKLWKAENVKEIYRDYFGTSGRKETHESIFKIMWTSL